MNNTEKIPENEQLAHAHLGAANSNLWLLCSGGFGANWLYEKKHGPEPSSELAEDGKQIHKIGARCLVQHIKASSLIGETIDGVAVDTQMANYAQKYVDYVRHYAKDELVLTERRVDYSHAVPNGFGTLDAGYLDYNTGIYHLFDGKFGAGIKVSAVNSNQLQLYAVGIYKEFGMDYPISSFRLHCVQPPMNNYSSWNISVRELLAFQSWASERAVLAVTDGSPKTPGVLQCEWCRVSGDCNALAQAVEKSVHVDFDTLVNFTEPDIDALSEERKVVIMRVMPDIIKWFKNVDKSVYKHVLGGGTFPGMKMVEGRGSRDFSEAGIKRLIELLGKGAFNEKLIGLGDAEKKLGKDVVDAMTVKKKGSPKLVDESHKSPAINHNPFKK